MSDKESVSDLHDLSEQVEQEIVKYLSVANTKEKYEKLKVLYNDLLDRHT